MAQSGCRRPDRIETAFAEWLEGLPLHALADLLGGLPEDARAFFCPSCQGPIISGDRVAIEYPAAGLVVDGWTTRCEATQFACSRCGLQGTRWRLARACLESPAVFHELFTRRRSR
jgi:hypothetical protein